MSLEVTKGVGLHENDDARSPQEPLLAGGWIDSLRCAPGKCSPRLLPQIPNLLSDVSRDLSQVESIRGGLPLERISDAGGDGRAGQAAAGLARCRGLQAHVAGNGLPERSSQQRSVRAQHEDGEHLLLEPGRHRPPNRSQRLSVSAGSQSLLCRYPRENVQLFRRINL